MEWLLVAVGYLLGTIPTAYIVGKRVLGKDIRKLGDLNMGARNAYFEIGHKAGIIIFLVDFAKGLIAILIPQLLNASQPVVLFTGVAAVAGHNWPFFLGFRGGRGEATTMGVLAGLIPIPMLIMAVPTILTLLIVKNVIAATAVMFIGLPVVDWILGVSGLMVVYGIALPVLVALTHYFRARNRQDTAHTGTA